MKKLYLMNSWPSELSIRKEILVARFGDHLTLLHIEHEMKLISMSKSSATSTGAEIHLMTSRKRGSEDMISRLEKLQDELLYTQGMLKKQQVDRSKDGHQRQALIGRWDTLSSYKHLSDVPQEYVTGWNEHFLNNRTEHIKNACKRGKCWFNIKADVRPPVVAEYVKTKSQGNRLA